MNEKCHHRSFSLLYRENHIINRAMGKSRTFDAFPFIACCRDVTKSRCDAEWQKVKK